MIGEVRVVDLDLLRGDIKEQVVLLGIRGDADCRVRYVQREALRVALELAAVEEVLEDVLRTSALELYTLALEKQKLDFCAENDDLQRVHDLKEQQLPEGLACSLGTIARRLHSWRPICGQAHSISQIGALEGTFARKHVLQFFNHVQQLHLVALPLAELVLQRKVDL